MKKLTINVRLVYEVVGPGFICDEYSEFVESLLNAPVSPGDRFAVKGRVVVFQSAEVLNCEEENADEK